MTRMRRISVHLLVALVVLTSAAALRIVHLDWGLPVVEEEALPSKVAIRMWGFDDGTPDLDPGTAGWPALSFYVQRAAQQIQYFAGRVSGDYSVPLDYYVEWLLDPTDVILLGRWISVIAGLVVCIVGFLLGRAWAGTAGGLVAGMVCALSPLLVEHSQLVEPDALVTMFSALAIYWAWRVAEEGKVRDYAIAGLWIGLGTAAKYTPALMAITLYIVHLERRRAEGLSNRYLGLDDRRLGWAALVSFLSFCVASPYTLANLAVLRRDFAYQALHMSSGHFGHEQQGLGYGVYLLRVLPAALGWPALIAGLTGLALTARGQRAERVALWSLLPFFVVLGSLSTHFDRYMLPAILPLALGCALLLNRIRAGGARRVAISGAVLVLLIVAPARQTASYHQLQGAQGTQEMAADWLRENMDTAREVLATERYGPALQHDQRDQLRQDPAFARMSVDQQNRLLGRPFVRMLTIPMYSVRTELTGYYYDLRNFLAHDWLVTSGAVRNRYMRDPERFPRQVAFYQLLDELLEPAWAVRPQGSIRGPSQLVYRLDDEFRASVRERLGPRAIDHFRAFGGEIHAPHFLAFVQTIANHAEFRERWPDAAYWYEVLAQAAMTPAMRALGYEEAGLAYLQIRQYRAARDMFGALRNFPEREVVALGNLGLIAEETGDPERARELYREVIDKDRQGEAGIWAQRRLAALEGRER